MFRHKKPEQTNTGMATNENTTQLMMNQYEIDFTESNTSKMLNYPNIDQENLTNLSFEEQILNNINCSSDKFKQNNQSYDSDISCCSRESYQQNEEDLIPIEDLNNQIMKISNMDLLENNFDENNIEFQDLKQFSEERSSSKSKIIFENQQDYSIEEELPETILSKKFLEEIKNPQNISLNSIKKIENIYIESEDEEFNDLNQTFKLLKIPVKKQKNNFTDKINQKKSENEDDDYHDIKLGKHNFFECQNQLSDIKPSIELKKIKTSDSNMSSLYNYKKVES